jgi:hypothetical protein
MESWSIYKEKSVNQHDFLGAKKDYSYATSNTGILIGTLTAIILNSCFICRTAGGRFKISKTTRLPI